MALYSRSKHKTKVPLGGVFKRELKLLALLHLCIIVLVLQHFSPTCEIFQAWCIFHKFACFGVILCVWAILGNFQTYKNV